MAFDSNMVAKKIDDYRLQNYRELLVSRIDGLEEVINGGKFGSEMRRFVPVDVYERTLGKPKYLKHVELTLSEMLQRLQRDLFG